MKKTVLVTLILLFTLNVSAYSLGTFTYQTSKTATANTTFKMGFVNLGNETVEVDLSATDFEHGDIVFSQKKFDIRPSEVSKNPEGSGWINVGNGRYARVRDYRFWVLTDRASGKHRFSIRVEGRKKGYGIGNSIAQKLVQVREYQFELDYAGDTGSRSFSNPDDSGPNVIRKTNDPENVNNSTETQNSSSNVSKASENSEKNHSKSSKGSDDSSSTGGVDGMTVVLGIGALGSIAYLWTVI